MLYNFRNNVWQVNLFPIFHTILCKILVQQIAFFGGLKFTEELNEYPWTLPSKKIPTLF